MCKDCGASFVRRGNLKNHIVKCHPDDPMLTSENRDRTEGKVECSGEVKEMHKEMTGNSGKVEVVEEVEQDTVVAIEKESYEIPIVKQKEAVAESPKEMVESVSKQEMTWGEMEIFLRIQVSRSWRSHQLGCKTLQWTRWKSAF